MATNKKYALGRGLDALISTGEVHTSGSSSINEVPLADIKANPNQPRREFDAEAMEELAESIRQIGIIQPITLRKMDDGTYQIIAGERRWRASQMAGLETVPAYIRTADDEKMMQMALVENIQREDLNAIEIALAYQNLLEQYGLTQDALSEKVGKKRTTIANYLRLLKLPAEVQMGIKERKLDMGHARAILGSSSPEQQLSLYHRILTEGLSVRRVEELVNVGQAAAQTPRKPRKNARSAYPAQQLSLEEHLHRQVKVSENKITISFKDEQELNAIIDQLRN